MQALGRAKSKSPKAKIGKSSDDGNDVRKKSKVSRRIIFTDKVEKVQVNNNSNVK